MEDISPVTNTGFPTPNKTPARSQARGKRERPCDGCRRRKGRCVVVEGQTQCAACAVHKLPCTYLEDPKPRKRKPDTGPMTTPVSSKKKSHTYPLPIVPPLTTSRSNPEQSSAPDSHGAHAVAPAETSLTMANEHQMYVGPTTEYEPSLIKLSLKVPDAGIGTIRDYGHATFFVSPPDTAGTQKMAAALQVMLKPHVSSMAEVYRRTVHESFPVLDDATLTQLVAGNMAACDTLVVAAMFLAVAPWNERPEETQKLSRHDKTTLEGFTFGLFTQSLYQPTLNSVQAGLLLMQCSAVDTKALNTQLADVGYELGLHLDCSSWDLTATDKALRRRLAWAVYMQDKWCALIHGRPSAIVSSNWAVRPLSDADFAANGDEFTKTEASDGKSQVRRHVLFIQMMYLTRILAEIISSFYSVSAMSEVDAKGASSLRFVLEKVKRVQLSLKDWHNALPSCARMDHNTSSSSPSATAGAPTSLPTDKTTSSGSSPSSSSVPSTYSSSASFLHLAYYATEITLHRCIIRAQPADPLADAALVGIVRTAAKERLIGALEFSNRLRSPALSGFWYFSARTCFAVVGAFGALLAATSPALEEAAFYAARLREFRWTLGVAGKDAPWLAHAARTADSLLLMLDAVPRKPAAADLAADRERLERSEKARRRAARGSASGGGGGGGTGREGAGAGTLLGSIGEMDDAEQAMLDDEDDDDDDDGDDEDDEEMNEEELEEIERELELEQEQEQELKREKERKRAKGGGGNMYGGEGEQKGEGAMDIA